MISIAKRIENGWTEYQPNKSKTHCDDCGGALWVAPDGKTLYCDNLSKQHIVKLSDEFMEEFHRKHPELKEQREDRLKEVA